MAKRAQIISFADLQRKKNDRQYTQTIVNTIIDSISIQLSDEIQQQLSTRRSFPEKYIQTERENISKTYTESELQRKDVRELKNIVRQMNIKHVESVKAQARKQEYIDAILGKSKRQKRIRPVIIDLSDSE